MGKHAEPLNGLFPPVPFSNSKTGYSLGQTLYRELLKGSVVDNVVLLAGGGEDRVRLNVHKCVLRGVSDLFKVELGNVIDLPETISVKAVMSYIQAMYLEELDDLKLDCLLEVMTLSDMHKTTGILEMSKDAVIQRIDKDNCFRIFKITRDRNSCQNVRDTAIACFQKNMGSLLEESVDWSKEIWEDVLFVEGPDIKIEENLLFSKLWKWRNADPASRDGDFCDLVKLIRFPLMTANEILDIDHTTGIFSDKEVVDLLSYVHKGTKYGRRLTTFNTDPRRKKVARNTEELHTILTTAEDGDLIQLLEGEYFCSFQANTDKFTLKGVGRGTKLFTTETWMMITVQCEGDIDKESNRSKDGINYEEGEYKRHCDIFGPRNVLKDVEFMNCSLIFGMFGGSSRISCLTFESPSNGFLYRHSVVQREECKEGKEFIGCSVFVT